MAVIGTGQVTLVDLTDAYSVILTSEAYVFPGTTSAAKAGSTTTQVIAMRGAEQVAATVTLSECTVPTGITLSKDTDATAPTITITASTSLTAHGDVVIPVHIGSDITITKKFSVGIALTGATGDTGTTGATGKGISSTAITYQAASSGTTIPTGTWSTSVPAVSAGQYLWTRTVMTYTDSTSTTGYSVGMMGSTGTTGATGKGINSTTVTYQASSSGTTAPTGAWTTTIPSVSASQYLWTRTIITYSDSSTSTAYAVGMMGATGAKGDTGATGAKGDTGAKGADAIVVSVTSSNGFIFKNTSVATTLTAHVYQAGVELNATQIAALGTIKWYKDGSTTATSTGATLAIDAGQVTNKASYVAQLEG